MTADADTSDERIDDTFEWDVPDTFNFSSDVIDRWADDPERLEKVLGYMPELTEKSVRFRTLGCFPLTGAVESEAATLSDIVQEMLLTTTSERQGRVIDKDSGDASMEKKKQEGYF